MSRTLLTLLLLALPATLAAQEDQPPGNHGLNPARGNGLRLTVGGYGIGIGNVPRVNGIRLNVRDSYLEAVNGLNLTVWKPAGGVRGTVNGLALGLVLPSAHSINGLGVGGLGVLTRAKASGVFAGGLATVAQGGLDGVGAAGLAVVAGGHSRGIMVGGLSAFNGGDLVGVAAGGLAVIVDRDLEGAALGGLAVVATRDLTGIGLGGLAVVAGDRLRGVAVAGAWLKAERFAGFGAALYTDVGVQHGVTIGIYNSADRLKGLQIGLLNRAGNRTLPLLNWGF